MNTFVAEFSSLCLWCLEPAVRNIVRGLGKTMLMADIGGPRWRCAEEVRGAHAANTTRAVWCVWVAAHAAGNLDRAGVTESSRFVSISHHGRMMKPAH